MEDSASAEPLIEHTHNKRQPKYSCFWLFGSLIVLLNMVFFIAAIYYFKQQCTTTGFGDPEPLFSPANDYVEYYDYTFDQGYGQNFSGKRVYYAGEPSPEIDRVWDQLRMWDFNRIDEKEADKLAKKTAPLHSGGHIMSLDVFHQLHCLNFIRKALDTDYYPPLQSPKAHKFHIYHCINSLRQALICAADTTPITYIRHEKGLNTPPVYEADFNIKHRCRNFDKIFAWAKRTHITDQDLEIM